MSNPQGLSVFIAAGQTQGWTLTYFSPPPWGVSGSASGNRFVAFTSCFGGRYGRMT